MAVYVFANSGIPIFDATGEVITLNSAGQTINHAGNELTITTGYGLPNDGASSPRSTPQQAMTMKFYALITVVILQVIRDQDPTTTSKLCHTPQWTLIRSEERRVH